MTQPIESQMSKIQDAGRPGWRGALIGAVLLAAAAVLIPFLHERLGSGVAGSKIVVAAAIAGVQFLTWLGLVALGIGWQRVVVQVAVLVRQLLLALPEARAHLAHWDDDGRSAPLLLVALIASLIGLSCAFGWRLFRSGPGTRGGPRRLAGRVRVGVACALALGAGAVAFLLVEGQVHVRQKRTVRDMEAVVSAVIGFSVDHDAFPVRERASMDELVAVLTPTYADELPIVDGWGYPMAYSSDGTRFLLISHGKHGLADPAPRGAVTSLTGDIVFDTWEFTHFPP